MLAACGPGEPREENSADLPGVGATVDDATSTEAVETDTAATNLYVYTCEDGYQFTARVAADTARIFLATRTVALPHVVAASGAKYSNGEITYWSKADSARFEIGNQTYTSCRGQPAESP